MKKCHFKPLIIIVPFLFTASYISPIVTHISVWRKKRPNGYHYCYFVHDWHHDYKDSAFGEKQRDDIIEMASLTKNPLVIIEAAADYDGPHTQIAQAAQHTYHYYQSFKDNPDKKPDEIYPIASFLCSGLLTECTKHGISTKNAECRHFNYASIPWQDALDDVNRHMQEIALFQHYHPQLAKSYLFLEQSLQKITSQWSQQRINDILDDQTLSAEEQQSKAKEPYTALFKLGFHLLNAKTLCALLQSNHPSVFVCLGAAHIECIENHEMPGLGYEKVLHELDKPFLRPVSAMKDKDAMNNIIDIKHVFLSSIFPFDLSIVENA